MGKLLTAGVAVFAGVIGAAALWNWGRPFTDSFQPSEEPWINPLMGYAPSADSTERKTESSLVYMDITWKELEPEEGEFQWEAIEKENHMAQWRREGKHAVLRFVCDIPSDEAHRDIPDWLYERTGGDGTDYDISYGKGYSPDYNNETLIACHERAIAALGERYGQDSFVSFVELGSLGHWGEWHIKYDSGIKRMPFGPVREQYIKPYLTAFPNARILMRRPFDAAVKYGFGVYNDMAGEPESTEEWLEWIRQGGIYSQTGEACIKAMSDGWKEAPVGGEFTSDIGMEEMLGDQLSRTVELIEESHTTFLGPKAPHMTENAVIARGAREIQKHMGYRLRISKMKLFHSLMGKKETLKLTWTNDGVAPMYWDWPVFLYIMGRDGTVRERLPIDIDLRKIIPGKSVQSKTPVETASLGDGDFVFGVGIEDPMTGQPSVYLAMDSKRDGTISIIYEEQK